MNHAAFIWSVADRLRGDYKQSDYGKVILPFTVLRRLDCILESVQADVRKAYEDHKDKGEAALDIFLRKASGREFYNTSPFTLKMLLDDAPNIRANLENYVSGFSSNAREIFEKYDFLAQIDRLDEADLLYQIVQQFTTVDLHIDHVSNSEMGHIFEELIRKFAELSNETAGEHFTPREVIRLMVHLLIEPDISELEKPGTIRSIYDPCAGTGGMLSVASDYLAEMNPQAKLVPFGQELNGESYAVCKADMLINGNPIENIHFGNTLSQDGEPENKFDYLISNPPFGVEWKKVQKAVSDEHNLKGFAGRFGPGLPRVSDGSLLFLMHMVSKMKPVEEGGSRIGIVLNGSPLFTGGAGSGESEIRRWIIENDFLEAIVALPTDMFYNTGIATYIWILTNRKTAERKGKIQLINGVSFFQKMKKSLGNKRNELGDGDIAKIVKIHGVFEEDGKLCKIFDNEKFGFTSITVERPLKLNFQVSPERVSRIRDSKALLKLGEELLGLTESALSTIPGNVYRDRDEFTEKLQMALKSKGVKLGAPAKKALLDALSEADETAEPCRDSKGRLEPDSNLRDSENVPLKQDIDDYFAKEVLPHVPDAWIDESKHKVGYEIPFNRHFYEYKPPRPLEEIDAELDELSREIMELLREVHS